MKAALIEMQQVDAAFSAHTLRTALALSVATGKPFRVFNLRATDEKPGLLRRHVAAVRAAAAVCSASVDGAEIGSTELAFSPDAVRAGPYQFAVGAAGCVGLVLQAVLPGLLVAGAASVVTVDGGTHVAGGPTPEFFDRALSPLIGRMGARVAVTVERAGFYPAGGGRVVMRVEPAGAALAPIHVEKRGEVRHRLCRASVAGLPGEIALRELALIGRMMDWPAECLQIRQLPEDQGPGNAVAMEVGCEHVTEVFAGCGARGRTAEAVAEGVIQQAKAYLASGAAVGPHLGDQLLVLMALARGGSFVTDAGVANVEAGAVVVRAMCDVAVMVEESGPGRTRVVVG